jgi:hypothetical protein
MYCKNYLKTFEKEYPKATKVLAELGINVDYPLEIIDFCWNEKGDKRIYESYYLVKGELFEDKTVLYDEDAVITLYRHDTDAHIYVNTGMSKPYFIAQVTNIELPWVLEEQPFD